MQPAVDTAAAIAEETGSLGRLNERAGPCPSWPGGTAERPQAYWGGADRPPARWGGEDEGTAAGPYGARPAREGTWRAW
jgi:hypothetical protein